MLCYGGLRFSSWGGVTGIQAALDLADRGIKVHIVEKSPSIGGVMTQLYKTFPTNDARASQLVENPT